MRSAIRPPGAILALAIALAIPTVADAADAGLLDNSWFASIGAFKENSDTTIELDGTTTTGSTVDFDRDFGKIDATRFRFDGFWRFGERHKLRVMWFQARKDATRTISEDIDWGDETFPAGASVTFEGKFDIYELAYEYAFMRRESFELGASAGLHYAKISASLAATLDVPGGEPGETRAVSDEAGLKAPLPVIGVHGTWNPGGKFWIDGGAQLFALSFDKYDGHLVDYRLSAIWQPKTWLGLGLGYDYCETHLDVDGDRFNGTLDWTYSGPNLFLSAAF